MRARPLPDPETLARRYRAQQRLDLGTWLAAACVGTETRQRVREIVESQRPAPARSG